MQSIRLDVCEICGTLSHDHAGWFSVAGDGARMEVLPWTEDLGARSDCRHACCGDHLEKLVLASAVRGFDSPILSLTTERGGWNPASLVSPAGAAYSDADGSDTLAGIFSAIDSILQNSADEEEEDAPAFDA